MEAEFHEIEDRDDALTAAEALEPAAAELSAEFRDTPLPDHTVRRLIERSFGRPETVLMEARGGGQLLGTCLTAPFEDPLTGELLPMIVLLHVDPDVRHRGVARGLVEHTLRTLETRGLTELAARAAHNDDALISMGERWGFVRHWEMMLLE